MYNFMHKKIGIWGFGVVGQSALNYFDQHTVASIEILDTKPIQLPTTKHPVAGIIQNCHSIIDFLERNNYILVSPGIKLHDYQKYADKFIAELDLYQTYKSAQTIAITGSLGKTSVTHLLTSILQKMQIDAIAAGNIGHAMLNLITKPKKTYEVAILELSSFQLSQAQTFAPDLAIITNLYENHLDHHKNMQEYCAAKCNIFIHQSINQKTLLPLELIDQITTIMKIKKNWMFFSPIQPTEEQITRYFNHTIYYLDHEKLYKKNGQSIDLIFDCTNLPAITFATNWLIIIAALDLQKLPLTGLITIAQNLDIPDHRLQKIGSHQGSSFYNDSKSTVWQATLQAVLNLEKSSTQRIKLFVGGLSKGADRTPLFAALQGKAIEVFAFGQQADQITKLCNEFKIRCSAHATLDAAWQNCIENLHTPSEILFSPGGASYDLFANYQARGQHFTKLVSDFCNN